MYFARITQWHRPWWQPKWMRRYLSRTVVDSQQGLDDLKWLDQARVFFGSLVVGLLCFEWSPFIALTTVSATNYRQWTWLFLGEAGGLWLGFALYNLIRHYRLHTYWTKLDLVWEILCLPGMRSATWVGISLLSSGLLLNYQLSPLIGLLVGLIVSVLGLEYAFVVMQWHYYWLVHLQKHLNYQDGLV